MKLNVPAHHLDRFHDLAAQFEFIEGHPRGLAEKRALKMLESLSDPLPSDTQPEALELLVVDVWRSRISGIDYLRFSIPGERCFEDGRGSFNKAKHSYIPVRFIDAGQAFYVGRHRYIGEWFKGVRQIRLRRL